MDFSKNFALKTRHISNYTGLAGPKIVIQYFLVSLFIESANTFKMYMTSRAAKCCLGGRRLENPAVYHTTDIKIAS